MSPRNSVFEPGDTVRPGLVIERRIARGGMGEVFLAQDAALNRRVALKALYADEDPTGAAHRLHLEARAIAQVTHPHIVAVHAIGHAKGTVYLEMEYVEGMSLREALADGPVPLDDAGTWVAQAASALDAAHELGVLHCDVKPDNILLRRKAVGGALEATLVDFGLARSRVEGTIDLPVTHGTRAYLAPELVHRAPTAKADVFALAAVAHELLFGEPPMRVTWLDAPHLGTPARPATQLGPAAIAALSRALDPDPDGRPATAGEFADALLRGLGLGHLRNGRGGPDAQTTAQLAIPLYSYAATDGQLRSLVTTILALLPSNYPRALTLALGCEVPRALVAQLRAEGIASGVDGDLCLNSDVDRNPMLQQLDRKTLRNVMARTATAVEVTGPRNEATRELATRLYMSARRTADAARLAMESATAVKDAAARRQHIARAAALCATATQPRRWLEALVILLEWDMACGWVAAARQPLGEAQGLAADAGLPADDPVRVRLDLGAIWVSLALGQTANAESALDRLEGRGVLDVAHRGTAAAQRLRILLMRGELDAASRLTRTQSADREGLAWSEFWSIAALLAQHRGERAYADHALRLAQTAALDAHDDIGLGRATLAQAEVLYHRAQLEAGLAVAESAVDVLRARGTMSLTGYACALRGQIHAALGDALHATTWLARSEATFAALGLHAARIAALSAQAAVAQRSGALGAEASLRAERERLLRRSARDLAPATALDRVVFAFFA
ncbi:MAG: serine/threonine protein kinase [Deltaproteobacteria bacterium]|nr:serine/threonine protein kinase [Deltaproteobacteria bacterium]